MPAHSDLTFITNEKEQTLLERFHALTKDTQFFDVLVGYFYTSGFHAIHQSLEKTEKIRILIGISTNRQTGDLLRQARQRQLQFSHAETKERFAGLVTEEIAAAEDSRNVEDGVAKFIDWLQSGKLTIKAYPTENIHAKLYIMTFPAADRDAGRVITGSSNFTQAGLVDNLEFNVELKQRADYEFAKQKFEHLWQDAVDVGEQYIQTIRQKTWLNDSITPHQLYLKFLYEYFKDELNTPDDTLFDHFPPGFKRLEYQKQAVLNAKKILEEYGGVFISDVVGLGKTYVSAMLASQLKGKTLVLAPPVLLDRTNPGAWQNVFFDFNVPAIFESLGKLEQVIDGGTDRYDNVFIDEAHRFRTESNATYEKLARICRGKRVVLVTATPLNNAPKDILSQIKLFQSGKKSAIPNVPDLDAFFSRLEKKIAKLDRQKDREKYMQTTRQNAAKIRDAVLKYLMVRRTRKEIETYFADDLKSQQLKFPAVENPEPIFYQLNQDEGRIFNRTVEFIAQKFHYARYMPMLYYKGQDQSGIPGEQSQKNMGRFMKIMLIKRLESSFHAFRRSVDRFISTHQQFLARLEEGHVYTSKKYANKIFELLDNEDGDAIEKLLEDDMAQRFPAADFSPELKKHVQSDLAILNEIRELWRGVNRDPKLLSFINLLSTNPALAGGKLIVFTESRETAEYLAENIQREYSNQVIAFTGASGEVERKRVIENFDARARAPKDDCRILIATEVLSEGVNLHRSNVVINYDIPWNPTRMMQRVGRINRVDTTFDKIHSFNFFPTEESNDELKLKEAAEAKIQAFITLLGADARLLTDGEHLESHELFRRLTSKQSITGEEEEEQSELKYLQLIRAIRDNDPALFEAVKNLPKKARTAKAHGEGESRLLTYFRKDKLQKFFITGGGDALELDFMQAAQRLEATPQDKKEKLPADFYEKLEANKNAFAFATAGDVDAPDSPRRGRNAALQMLKILKAIRDHRQYTEEQDAYLKKVMDRLEAGALPGHTVNTALKSLNKMLKSGNSSPLSILAHLQRNLPNEFLHSHITENTAHAQGVREVILSEYLMAE